MLVNNVVSFKNHLHPLVKSASKEITQALSKEFPKRILQQFCTEIQEREEAYSQSIIMLEFANLLEFGQSMGSVLDKIVFTEIVRLHNEESAIISSLSEKNAEAISQCSKVWPQLNDKGRKPFSSPYESIFKNKELKKDPEIMKIKGLEEEKLSLLQSITDFKIHNFGKLAEAMQLMGEDDDDQTQTPTPQDIRRKTFDRIKKELSEAGGGENTEEPQSDSEETTSAKDRLREMMEKGRKEAE